MTRTLRLLAPTVLVMVQLVEHQVIARVAVLVVVVERGALAGQLVVVVAVGDLGALPEQTERFAAFLFAAARCRHATCGRMTEMLVEAELMLLTDHAVRLWRGQLCGARGQAMVLGVLERGGGQLQFRFVARLRAVVQAGGNRVAAALVVTVMRMLVVRIAQVDLATAASSRFKAAAGLGAQVWRVRLLTVPMQTGVVRRGARRAHVRSGADRRRLVVRITRSHRACKCERSVVG